MVTPPVPVLVSVTFLDAALPTVTEEKLRLLGVTFNILEAKPVPVNVTTFDPLAASLATVTLPDTEPADAGVNVTVIMRFFPSAIVTGRDSGLMLKPAPVTLGCCEMVTTEFLDPVFVSVNVWETLVPISTLPKLIDVLLTLSSPLGAANAAELRSINGGTVDANNSTTISMTTPCHNRFNMNPSRPIDKFPGA